MSSEIPEETFSEITRLVNKRYGSRVRSVTNNYIVVGDADLSDQQAAEVVSLAEEITELKDSELLYPLFLKEKDLQIDPVKAWENLAIRLLSENLARTGQTFDPLSNRVHAELEETIGAVPKLLEKGRKVLNSQDFIELQGKFVLEEQNKVLNIINVCPGTTLGIRWFNTAVEVINRFEVSRQSGFQ